MVISSAKQNYCCQSCDRQFIESYSPKGYREEVKRHCLTLYVNGMGFCGIQRSMKLIIIQLLSEKVGELLTNAPMGDDIPELTQINELQTFFESKQTRFGCGLRSTDTLEEPSLWVLGYAKVALPFGSSG